MNPRIPFAVIPVISLAATIGCAVYAHRVVANARAEAWAVQRDARQLMETANAREGEWTQIMRTLDTSNWGGAVRWSGDRENDRFVASGFCDTWVIKGFPTPSAAIREVARNAGRPAPKNCDK